MKMILGLDSRAISNICFTSLSLSPCHEGEKKMKRYNDEKGKIRKDEKIMRWKDRKMEC
jgi:hypothetical protein